VHCTNRVGGGASPSSHTTVRRVPYTAVHGTRLRRRWSSREMAARGWRRRWLGKHRSGGRPRCSTEAAAVIGRCPRPLLHKSSLQQTRMPARSPALPPQTTAQFAPHPSVQFLEDPLLARQPEVSDPTARHGREILAGMSMLRPRPWCNAVFTLPLNRTTLLGAARKRAPCGPSW
jgi:hypothetical protein